MKNPQNYKKHYKALNELRSQIIKDIKDKLQTLSAKVSHLQNPFLVYVPSR